MNVRDDAARLDELRELGFDVVPVVAWHCKAAHGVDLQQVANLVGLPYEARPELQPVELKQRQIELLGTLANWLDAIPPTAHQIQVPGRDRTIWSLIEHTCEIACVYRRVASQNTPFDAIAADAEVTGSATPAAIKDTINTLQLELSDEAFNYDQLLDTYFGTASLHYILERSTWHIAQHLRQLESLLKQENVAIRPVDPSLFDGLPMPKEVWD